MMSVLITEDDLNKIDSAIKIITFSYSEDKKSVEEAESVIDWLADIKFILTFKPDASNLVDTEA